MGRGATQVWWSWRRTIWTLWGLLAVSVASSCCKFSREAFVAAVLEDRPPLKASALQGLVLAYTVLAILTFVELFKVRCLGVRNCATTLYSAPLLPDVLRASFLARTSFCVPQVNLVKVPEYGRDATKGIATAMSMSFSMPPNLMLFLWMMLTKYGMQSLDLMLTWRWKT